MDVLQNRAGRIPSAQESVCASEGHEEVKPCELGQTPGEPGEQNVQTQTFVDFLTENKEMTGGEGRGGEEMAAARQTEGSRRGRRRSNKYGFGWRRRALVAGRNRDAPAGLASLDLRGVISFRLEHHPHPPTQKLLHSLYLCVSEMSRNRAGNN